MKKLLLPECADRKRKVGNFRNSNNKLAYVYLLTPHGVERKARMTVEFLKIKMQEYEKLRNEIVELKREVEQNELLQKVLESLKWLMFVTDKT